MRLRLRRDEGPPLDIVAGCLAPVTGDADLEIALGPGELRPGLINAHDHLHRNHYPRLGSPPYADAYAWGRDLHTRFAGEIAHARRLPEREAFLFGALKNLLGGVTTTVHHDPWHPCLDDNFPIRIARIRPVHSLGFEPDVARAARATAASLDIPLSIHLAEGCNPEAADEVRALAALGLLDNRLIAVHVVGPDRDGIERLRAARAAIVWCPTSNQFLFGRTTPAALLTSGIDVLLGTDALLTGVGTMLDELASVRCGPLDDTRLLDAVGMLAARRLGLPEPTLTPGAPADLVLTRRPILDAEPADVALVLVGGVPRLGEERFAPLFDRFDVAVEHLEVHGQRKLVAAPLGTIAARVLALTPECGRMLH